MIVTATTLALLLLAKQGDPLACAGPFVPPVDVDGAKYTYQEYEVAVAPLSTPVQTVIDAASEKLLKKLCRFDDRKHCAPLEAAAHVWQTGQDDLGKDPKRCAMVVIPVPVVEAWRKQIGPELDGSLRSALEQLVPATPTQLLWLGDVNDLGGPGGQRAAWIAKRAAAVLSAMNVDTAPPKPGWDGKKLPVGVTGLLEANLVDVVDGSGVPMLELAISLRTAKGLVRTANAVRFAARQAPVPPATIYGGSPASALKVVIDTSRAGGNLCNGDPTHVWVTNQTAQPLRYRVLNIDSMGNIIVVVPERDVSLKPDEQASLFDLGFSVQSVPGQRERFTAVAAVTTAGLEPFSRIKETCRVERTQFGEMMTRIEAIPLRGSDGFTVLDPVHCEDPPEKLNEKGIEPTPVDDLPVCQFP